MIYWTIQKGDATFQISTVHIAWSNVEEFSPTNLEPQPTVAFATPKVTRLKEIPRTTGYKIDWLTMSFYNQHGFP